MREVVYRFADGSETMSYEVACKSEREFECVVREVVTPYEPNPTLARIIAKKFPILADQE